jgi:hypothetical protein
MSMPQKPQCFVIMPFSGTSQDHTEKYWTKFFEKYLKPSLEECGYDARRSDARPQSITAEIIRGLVTEDLVLAVLTDRNPNVWYELGVRHASRERTIMIIEDGQGIPFDLKDDGIIHYCDSERPAFKQNLEQHIHHLAKGSGDNPVSRTVDMGMAYSINAARARLKQVTALIKDVRRSDEATRLISEFVTGSPKPEQVRSLIEDVRCSDEATRLISELVTGWQNPAQVSLVNQGDIIIWHQEKKLIGDKASNRWNDSVRKDSSLFPLMKDNRRGELIYQARSRTNRITAMAYETLGNGCMVIAEAHYSNQGRSPY